MHTNNNALKKNRLVELIRMEFIPLKLFSAMQLQGVATPGGGTLVFSYIRRLGSFLGVKNLEIQYFLGFSEK